MLVAGACAVALSFFNPVAGLVPVVALQEFKPKSEQETAMHIVRIFLTSKNESEKNLAWKNLDRMGSVAVVPAIISVLGNRNEKEDIRARAADLLFSFHDKKTTKQTINAFVSVMETDQS